MLRRFWYPFESPENRHMLYDYLLVPLLLVVIGILVENNLLFSRFGPRHAAGLQATLTHKEQVLDRLMDQACARLDSADFRQNPFVMHGTWEPALLRENLTLFIYQGDSLLYWSDNHAECPDAFRLQNGSPTFFTQLNDGWYVVHRRTVGDRFIAGYILVRQDYALQNNLLVNEFQKDFRLPESVRLSVTHESGSTAFHAADGSYLFSMVFDGRYAYQRTVPAILYLCSFLILLYLFFYKIPFLLRGAWKRAYLFTCTAAVCGLKYAFQSWHFPRVIYDLSLFDPELFASSRVLSSIGDLCIWVLLAVFIAQMLYMHLHLSERTYQSRYVRWLIPAGLVVTCCTFHFVRSLTRDIVFNSSFFSLDKSLNVISPGSIMAYVVLLLGYAVFFAMAEKTLRLCLHLVNFKQYLRILAATFIGFELLKGLVGTPSSVSEMIVLAAILLYAGWIRLHRQAEYRYVDFVVIAFVVALYTTMHIVQDVSGKHADEMEQQAVMLSLRQDPVAEYLLMDIQEKLAEDDVLGGLVQAARRTAGQADEVTRYLTDRYFSGYWRHYSLEALVCTDESDLAAAGGSGCLDLFMERVENQGVRIQRSNVWFMEDDAGAGTSYLAWVPVRKEQQLTHLFLKLDAIAGSSSAGYPQLLIDRDAYVAPAPQGYSYAIYHNGLLVQREGSFAYSHNDKSYQPSDGASGFMRDGKYRHYVFRDKRNFVTVVTKRVYTPMNCIILFSSIVFTFFCLISIGFLASFLSDRRIRPAWNFSSKIQSAMVGLLFLFNAAVSIATLTYLERQMRTKDQVTLLSQLESVRDELKSVTSGTAAQYLNPDDRNDTRLSSLLSNLSGIFHTDIHVYGTDGVLKGSSRPELFTTGLTGRRINPAACHALMQQHQETCVLNEHIGRMSFSSGYIVWENSSRQPMAIINLPSFEKREDLVSRVTALTAAALNISVLMLVIAIVLSMIITRTITQPLRMVQEKISQVSIDNLSNKIVYKGDDEVGDLVKAYNRVVDELSAAIQKLARSERESVWREMAKQVSHEINNPLTPMKLSVQHLQRAWESGSEKFDGYMQRIPKMLVEQIDLLSSIAQEFSSLAKMPTAYNQPIDIVAKISNAITLFGSNGTSIQFDSHQHDSVYIYADKEQMLRVFSNLFKNAEQAVPPEREAEIKVDLLVRDGWVYIRVKDNGNGIPEDMQDRIFKPAFTTKTKGMGLGLAIVKNTIEAAGGTIGFKSRQGRGTSFTMRLPECSPDRTPGREA